MITAFDTLNFYIWSNIILFALLVILPYLIRLIIIQVIRVITYILQIPDKKIQVQQFISVLFFPGSLLRITFIYCYLILQGWSLRVAYSPKVELSSGSVVALHKSQGFYLIMSQGKKNFSLRDALAITMLCYIPMLLGILMIINSAGNMRFIDYIFNRDFQFWKIHFQINVINRILYYYIIAALLIGGSAVPEETSVLLYYIVASYPHFIISCILALIGSILISYLDVPGPFSANYLGVSTLQVFWTILFVKVMLDDRELRLFEEDRFKFEEGIQEITLF